MSPIFLKGVGITFVAIVVIVLGTSLKTHTNRVAAAPIPTGTYWNVDAGFGDSELKFMDGSHYTNGGIGAVSVEGTYTLSHDQIVFLEFGPADAPCLHLPGTYAWSLERKVLTLKEIVDVCLTRKFDWGSGFWIAQPETIVEH